MEGTSKIIQLQPPCCGQCCQLLNQALDQVVQSPTTRPGLHHRWGWGTLCSREGGSGDGRPSGSSAPCRTWGWQYLCMLELAPQQTSAVCWVFKEAEQEQHSLQGREL